jgi:hypothetical protein
MKKLLFVVAILIGGIVNAQSDIQKKKADLFATEAIAHFKLDESKKASIAEAKLGLIKAQKEMEDKKKAGQIPEAEVEEYRKKNVFPFAQKLMKALEVKWPELDEFNKLVNPKLNAVKL